MTFSLLSYINYRRKLLYEIPDVKTWKQSASLIDAKKIKSFGYVDGWFFFKKYL